jgi:hypothetical protein
MVKFIIQLLISWVERRSKTILITGTAGPDDVYLVRYPVLKTSWMNIYIHRFLRSDRDDLHDHPWHFLTYLVSGAYKEWKYNPKTGQDEITFRTENHKRLVFRKAKDQHRVEVFEDLKIEDKEKAPLTLFISGPIIRDWGFIREEKRGHLRHRKWVYWKTYLGIK